MYIKKTCQQIYLTIFLLILSYGSLASDHNQLIKEIDFKRGNNGEGIVTIILPNQAIVPDIQKQADKIIINLPNTELPSQFNEELNVADFSTMVTKIIPSSDKQKTTLHIAALADYNYSFYQQNNILVITLWDANNQPQSFSANYLNTDIRIILKALSDHTKLNLVATDSVQGKMTLRTQNIRGEQALAIVLEANKLAKKAEGNVLLIATKDELAESPRKFIREPSSKPPHPSDLRRELIHIDYADAKTIIEAFQQQKAQQNKEITGERGAITVDNRTNTIIAYQTRENLEILRAIVAKYDIPAQQILLEARVIEVNKNYTETIKDQLNQGKLIDLLLYKMQKEGHGEIISQPKVKTADKEAATILKGQETHCHYNPNGCPKPLGLTIAITPEIINDSQIKLLISISIEKEENQESSIKIKKQLKRIVNNDQTLILDELDDLGYPLKNGDQSRLMLTITSSIINNKVLEIH